MVRGAIDTIGVEGEVKGFTFGVNGRVPPMETIIVLGNGGDWVHSDQKVLRTIITMQGMPSPPRGMLLCDVCRDENRELFEDIGGARVRAIVARDIGGVCTSPSLRKMG